MTKIVFAAHKSELE